VWPVAISGCTFEPGIHKMTGSEVYMKGLLEWEECKMFVEFHSHSLVTQNQATTFCHNGKLHILWYLSFNSFHLASVL
jgi:hypothetical protein